MAVAPRHREHEEGEHQNERDVRRAQVLGAHDVISGIEMEYRHSDGDCRHESRAPAREAVLHALFLLDHRLGAPQRLLADLGRRLVQSRDFFRHCSPSKLKSPARTLVGAYWAGKPYWSFTPFSAKYLTAPGCHGSGDASFFWFSSLKFSASLCTRMSSSRWSKIAFTML